MTTVNTLQILRIEPRHLQSVAEIHLRAFPASALAQLGQEAVRRYYEWQLTGPHDHHFVGVFDSGCLQAFAVGGKSRGALAGFVRRQKLFLVSRLLRHPGIIFLGSGRKALRAAVRVFAGRRNKSSPKSAVDESQKSFGVLAIAVDSASQRHGVGRMLMLELERAAVASGYTRMHLTVRPSNTKAIQFYEKLGWARVGDESNWQGRMAKALASKAD